MMRKSFVKAALVVVPLSTPVLETTGYTVEPGVPPRLPPQPLAAAVAPTSPTQFLSSVQMVIQEPTPELLQRSQKIVREQFVNTFSGFPELQGKTYEIRTMGNEVMLSLVTNEDVRQLMQQRLANIVEHLNGRVDARGRMRFYRTAITPDLEGYLEVKAEPDTSNAVAGPARNKIRFISAQSVPMRDLLKEVRARLGSLSYMVSGDCADRPVDLSFNGYDDSGPKYLETDTLMKTLLPKSLGISAENVNGTWVFAGNCADVKPVVRPRPPSPNEILKSGLTPGRPVGPGGAMQTQVFFPLSPLD